MNSLLEGAMWAGDVELLCELAPCVCCCREHTFGNCPARSWGGCRGQYAIDGIDEEAWARFYEETRGMSREEFFGLPIDPLLETAYAAVKKP